MGTKYIDYRTSRPVKNCPVQSYVKQTTYQLGPTYSTCTVTEEQVSQIMIDVSLI